MSPKLDHISINKAPPKKEAQATKPTRSHSPGNTLIGDGLRVRGCPAPSPFGAKRRHNTSYLLPQSPLPCLLLLLPPRVS